MRVVVPTLLLLSGCAPLDEAPLLLADAGSNVQGEAGQTYQLDGGDSSAARLTWRFVSTPTASRLGEQDLTDAHTPWPWFVADVDGLYTLELLGCAEAGPCARDRVQALVGPHARPTLVSSGAQGLGLGVLDHEPDPNNTAPIAEAIVRRSLGRTTTFTLDASPSDDPDGDALSYRWVFVTRPANSTLTNSDIVGRNSMNASVQPDVAGLYVIRLSVSDGDATDSVLLPPLVVLDRGWSDWDALPD